jgi:ATP-dependent Clp protease ATP-binding subunit ClpX
MLKQHLDQFVVGQERPKRILSVAVYNHYQRIAELQRQAEEAEELARQRERRMMGERHPVEGELDLMNGVGFSRVETPALIFQSRENANMRICIGSIIVFNCIADVYSLDEFPGQPATTFSSLPRASPSPPLQDHSPLTVDKSNILMLGPSGVGKTLMAKTLARVLEVPFSMSDCTPFTQAGYIGEDVDVCVARLLSAADYDVESAEHGIICLDEIDKIATAKVSHGKDVSGEGVQQALLKIIEGTTLQITAKHERSAPGKGGSGGPSGSGSGPLGSPGQGPGTGAGGKGEVYNVRTDNILFICTGAFINLPHIILDRISKGSIGFGAPIRSSSNLSSNSGSGGGNSGGSSALYNMKDEQALYRKHLPFFTANSTGGSNDDMYNPLDLVEPADLQKFGLIPELVGRIPVATALNALDEEALVRVLTEPRNCLVKQYELIFQFSGVELRFTSGALREIAKSALNMNTGARGLRTVMERLLADAMFDAPGMFRLLPQPLWLVMSTNTTQQAPP